MKRMMLWVVAFLALLGGTLYAQDIARDWQGTPNEKAGTIAGTWTEGPPLPLELHRATKETLWQTDSSPHTVSFVTVENDVKLEVLDWGGTGRPVVLLAGLPDTAHVFDEFAPKLTAKYHVYGITRRGFGASSSPPPDNVNYTADRLGDDVLAVLASLKIDKPVLVGHSIAGEEMSSVGSRHPEKVAGLVYLDSGYAHAYYDSVHGDLLLDAMDLRRKLDEIMPGEQPPDPRAFAQELVQTSLPRFEKDLQEAQKVLQAMPPAPPQKKQPPSPSTAIQWGMRKYTVIPVPILAIFALPHDYGADFMKDDPTGRAAVEARDTARTAAQADAFEKGLPSARVVRLANANHYVFRSNEADVLREMNAFIGSLAQ
ncbi:MAG: alpha/beta fold hydrolase [Edaphobacter sp.]